ncbi:MAG: WG repeat-containing protein [Thermodesulfobacteriota bacterium]
MERVGDQGELLPVVLNGKVGYIKPSGEMEILPKYDIATSFSEGLARILIGTKYGYINEQGDMVIEPKFDECFRLLERGSSCCL